MKNFIITFAFAAMPIFAFAAISPSTNEVHEGELISEANYPPDCMPDECTFKKHEGDYDGNTYNLSDWIENGQEL